VLFVYVIFAQPENVQLQLAMGADVVFKDRYVMRFSCAVMNN